MLSVPIHAAGLLPPERLQGTFGSVQRRIQAQSYAIFLGGFRLAACGAARSKRIPILRTELFPQISNSQKSSKCVQINLDLKAIGLMYENRNYGRYVSLTGDIILITRLPSLMKYCGLVWFLLHDGATAIGQAQSSVKEEPQIQDNSFFVEEAYNQERGIVQHISTFSRMWNRRDWSYSFTQEWPAPGNWRHQLSYTVVGMHVGTYSSTGGGMGDTIFNYRYQAIGAGESRVAFSPRLSVMFPTGDVRAGRGVGAVGVQTNLPVSIVLHRRIVTHWNAGSTFVPHAQNVDHFRARSVGYNFGESVIFVAHQRVNLMLETCVNRFQSVVKSGQTTWSSSAYMSPGVRWAYNFKSGLQIVPGAAMPIGIGSSAGETGVFLYLSLEHPFGASAER